jgi:hypothetical protein
MGAAPAHIPACVVRPGSSPSAHPYGAPVNTLHRRPYGAAVVGVLLAVGAAGCSSDDASAGGVPLDPATGAVLADAADRLADALDSGDPCRALAEAEALEERARGAVAEEHAPETVVAEAIRVVDATTAGLTCEHGGTSLAGDAEVAPEPMADDATGTEVATSDDGAAASDDGTTAPDTTTAGSSTAPHARDAAGPPEGAGPPGDRGRSRGRGEGRGRG